MVSPSCDIKKELAKIEGIRYIGDIHSDKLSAHLSEELPIIPVIPIKTNFTLDD